MRTRRTGQAVGLMVGALLVVGVGSWVARGQDPVPATGADAAKDSKAKSARKVPLRLRAPAREPGKGVRKAGVDPLANPPAAGANPAPAANANPGIDPNGPLPELGTYRYRYKMNAGVSDALSASYYPSKLKNAAPAVILVHEKDRSIKDFEEPLRDLKGASLAESLQKQGYAVMAIDLHGHGGNQRHELTPREWAITPGDLEVAYLGLVDRHNRGELNIAKLGVIALGEGANVAAAWVAGGGGVSSDGRASDVGALILVSPMGDAGSQGLRAASNLTNLAARVPLDLLVGERDAPSFELVDAVKPIVKRHRANQVETFPSALHAYQLLRLEPNLTASITKFLDSTIKGKVDEWEGRYLVDPIRYAEIKIIPNKVIPGDATNKAAPR